ncbi:MAG: biotin--[acetyl-CoA-carboxylase] ligase, partial [Candidatus Baltobacteraceae bacterium]
MLRKEHQERVLSAGKDPFVTADDPFSRVPPALAGTPFNTLHFSAATGSTNDDAAQVLGDRSARGCTLITDYQTKGAGRKGRSWIAPASTSLLFTTVLPNELAASRLWIVPFWTALAIRSALQTHRVAVDLQWPNDLLIEGAKVAGILCISRIMGESAWVGCGVGINVQRVDDPELRDILPAPAFISDIADISREELLISILQTFASTLSWLDD